MSYSVVTQKPAGATRDIGWDWSKYLQSAVAPTDLISDVTVTATGVTIAGQNHDTTTTVVRISGGVVGVAAQVTTTITTSSGEIEPATHYITIV